VVPFVTWGTNPSQGVALSGVVPSPDDFTDPERDPCTTGPVERPSVPPGR
jgi:3-isopropylmalate/(R)-2-methylmalate dehydratase large subunit